MILGLGGGKARSYKQRRVERWGGRGKKQVEESKERESKRHENLESSASGSRVGSSMLSDEGGRSNAGVSSGGGDEAESTGVD